MLNAALSAIMICVAAAPLTAQSSIEQSHIEANVPDAKSFAALLHRDLKTYFAGTIPNANVSRVEYQMLREGPTQTGVAFPKFYLWVTVYAGRVRVTEGSTRVAAIQRERFSVSHFISKREIVADPEKLQSVFPAALIAKILTLSENK